MLTPAQIFSGIFSGFITFMNETMAALPRKSFGVQASSSSTGSGLRQLAEDTPTNEVDMVAPPPVSNKRAQAPSYSASSLGPDLCLAAAISRKQPNLLDSIF
ncbi:uncharacterized protein BYT42DRAFT_615434 [Radiomyces spectabilis]|uniref:uncharacterized protein n=1 Tax=Radiomyces spectabilis TaxID=64574 RepID=UPI00221E4FEB|nr:uncharacterized protein BYT42DRAFT_615434 [Radiomyces spectabilis]KAI8374257.1 hypothetical protein BYT42DRAFT_615434 [Radiomyces spectabilis]